MIVFSLQVRKTVGAVAHLASALTKHGLMYKGHDVYGCSPEHCRVDIKAEGPEPQLEETGSHLRTFDEVIDVLDDNLVSRPGPRVVLGVRQIAEALHPEAFE